MKMDNRFNTEYIQKRCFNLLTWTLQHFTPKLQHFFITHNKSFNPFYNEIKFWDTGYQINDHSLECARKLKQHIYKYWEENYKPYCSIDQPFTDLVTDLLDPISPLCKDLQININTENEEYFGLHLELIGGAVVYLISSEALFLSDNKVEENFNLQTISEFASDNQSVRPYRKIRDTKLIAVLSYNAKKNNITPENIHIYLARYIYARLSSTLKKRLPSGYIPILLPLKGLGQLRAIAGWICPKNKLLKDHLRLVRKTQPESLISAIEEIYSVNLIEIFIFLLEEVLSKPSDSIERMRKSANAFSQLWISEEIKFYREGVLVLHLKTIEKPMEKQDLLQSNLNAEYLMEKVNLLTIEEDLEKEPTVVLNLNKHSDIYFLRRALGFDLVIYKNCPGIKLNLPGQEEYWEVQLRERLSRTAATIIKEQYFLTQGLTHEIMNTLSRRSRYRVLYAKALNNQPIENRELLYTCSILQELYYLTDTIRTVTKFDDPKTYLMKLVSTHSFDLEKFFPVWQKTIKEVVEQILFGLNHLGIIPVIFHKSECCFNKECNCHLLEVSNNFSQLPIFEPFSIEATSLFLVGIHEILGNAIQYLVKQKEAIKQMASLINETIDSKIDIRFSLVLEKDSYYELRFGNPVYKDEKPRGLSDGLRRTQNLLSCFVFQDSSRIEKNLIEFCLVDDLCPNYHTIMVKFRPHIVFQDHNHG